MTAKMWREGKIVRLPRGGEIFIEGGAKMSAEELVRTTKDASDDMAAREAFTIGEGLALEEQYRTTVTKWAQHFSVSVPTVRVSKKNCCGVYNYFHWRAPRRRLLQRITMPVTSCKKNRTHLDILIHEFAHHLDFAPGKGKVGYHPDHSGHGESFRKALVQVATVAYGNPRAYPWESEYKRVAQWAIEKGWAA